MVPIITFFVGSAVGGAIGNKTYALACKAAPRVRDWIRGEDQPVNHHLQRALRTAFLSATKDLLEDAGRHADSSLVEADTRKWFEGALIWVAAEVKKLEDKLYVPPLPPGGWEPSLVVEPEIQEAAALAAVARLRETLAGMLANEWIEAKLGPPPAIRHECAFGRLVRANQPIFRRSIEDCARSSRHLKCPNRGHD